MPALIFLGICVLIVIALYMLRDKTEWVYEGNRRHDKANPKRVQVWDDSEMNEWHSGEWVDA